MGRLTVPRFNERFGLSTGRTSAMLHIANFGLLLIGLVSGVVSDRGLGNGVSVGCDGCGFGWLGSFFVQINKNKILRLGRTLH